jgi:tRNA threonylcarbamoyladenosine biosynthesis protein TsaB
MYNPKGKLVIGLETGINGGGVSILENDRQIDFADGSGNVSKSEDLLSLLESLFEKNNFRKSDIGLIAVSDEPGSLTGIRIGLAIAKGLGDALSVPVRRISVLDAMAEMSSKEGIIISALSTNRNGIYFREYLFQGNELRKKRDIKKSSDSAEFAGILKNFKKEDFTVVSNEGSKEALISRPEGFLEQEDFAPQGRFYFLNQNLAEILARAATKNRVR